MVGRKGGEVSTREEVANVLDDCINNNRRRGDLIDALMLLPALRLAEKAEQNKDWKLAVVDTNKGVGFQEEADYLLVIEVAP